MICCLALIFTAVVCEAQSAENTPPVSTLIAPRPPESITVVFATLRNRSGSPQPSDTYGGERGDLSAGIATVTFEPIWGLEEVAASAPFYVPDEKIRLTAVEQMPLETLFAELEDFSGQDNGNLVVYIHGYNIDFAKSCRRSALFQRALGLHDRLLLFSWPADGNMLKYTWDEEDLVWSVPHMAAFFEEIITRAGRGKLDMVAHSLGARGAFQALVRMAYRGDSPPALNELILIAPDIDAAVFRLDLPLLKRMAKRITVYVSENDKALKLSHEVHGYPRLGQVGDHVTVLGGVETIDISALSSRRISGHLYHLFNPEVIADLTRLLHDGEPAEKRPGLQKIEQGGGTYWQLLPSSQDNSAEQ